MPSRYGPLSYYRLGRAVPRERLRDPYSRDPWESRYGGIFIPNGGPEYERVGCVPPPARHEEAAAFVRLGESRDERPARAEGQDSRPRAVEGQDSRPARTGDAEARPARRDECR